MLITEYNFPIYDVYSIKYLSNYVEIDFKVLSSGYGMLDVPKYYNEGTLYLKYNNGNFNFDKM